MIDWEKVARAETHPTRLRVLEAIDELGDGAHVSPSEIGPKLGIKPRQVEKQLEALRKRDLIDPYKPRSDRERFEKYVIKGVGPNEDCWGWNGFLKDNGYASFYFNGGPGYAHRFSYELHHGAIPEGMAIDHLCRNRGCVNPDHLEVVTQQENVRRGEITEVLWGRKHPSTCRNGHPMTEENTIYVHRNQRPGRACLTCRNERKVKSKEKMRARRAARRTAEIESEAA